MKIVDHLPLNLEANIPTGVVPVNLKVGLISMPEALQVSITDGDGALFNMVAVMNLAGETKASDIAATKLVDNSSGLDELGGLDAGFVADAAVALGRDLSADLVKDSVK